MWNVYVIIAINTFIYYYTDQNKSSSTGVRGPVALLVEN